MATASDNNGGPFDVVIVGAGISGLCAAYDILKEKRDCKILVLEAKDRVGGRLVSEQLKTATGVDTWDLGGQWVGKAQKDIMNLLEELDIGTYEQWYTGEKLIELGDGTLKKYSGGYPSVSFWSLLDVYLINSKIEKMCTVVPVDDPSKCPNAAEWDSMTLDSWIRQNAWTTACTEMFDIVVGTVFGVTPAQMSLLYALHYIKTCGGWSLLVESGVKGGAQELKIKGSAHNVALLLAERIGWNKIRLEQPVASIKQCADEVNITTHSGHLYTAKYAILAIPPHLTSKIEFTPRLPYNRQRITENMIPSHLIKFIATYPTAFWRKNGLSGEAAHYTGRNHCEVDPVSVTFDGSTSNGSPAILGFISSYAAAKWSGRTETEKKEVIIKSLGKYFGPEAEVPLDCAVKEWSQEDWNGGCPVDIMVPGAIMNYGDCLREPFQRVHWAATETSTVHRGYISGAVSAGHRAASEVIKRLIEC